MKSQWWFASDGFPAPGGMSPLVPTTQAGSPDWSFHDAQKLSVVVEGVWVRDNEDGFAAGDNDLVVATKHRIGDRPIIDKIHFLKQEVPAKTWVGAFFHPAVYSTNDFREREADELTLELRVYDEDSLSDEQSGIIDGVIAAASQVAAIAFPVFAPFAGLAANAGQALVDLVEQLDDHDRIIEGRIRLAINKPSDQGWDLLQPGFLVCFADEIAASGLHLGQDRRVYGKNGKWEEFRHQAYAVLRVSRSVVLSPDQQIDQRAATLLSELESGKGERRTQALAFLRHTFAAYSTLTRLERLGELAAVDPALLTADERALLDELRADPAVGRFLRLS